MSLIEILMAIALVIVIFTPIIALMSTATIRAYRGGDETIATIYANDVIEIIRGAPYDSFMPKDNWMSLQQVLYEHNIPTGYELEKYEDRFTVAAKVSSIEGYPSSLIKQVTVKVSWKPKIALRSKKRSEVKDQDVILSTFYTPSK